MSTAQGERGWAVPASVGCAAEVVMSSARLLLSASVLSEQRDSWKENSSLLRLWPYQGMKHTVSQNGEFIPRYC